MYKILPLFIVFVLAALFFLMDTDPVKPIVQKQEIRQEAKKSQAKAPTVNITPKKVAQIPKKVEKKVQDQFQEHIKNNQDQMVVLSQASADGYTLQVKSMNEPKKNEMSPPSFPTILRGEINGKPYNLTLNDEAKKENLYLVVSKNQESALIPIDTLRDTKAGEVIDIGNLNPPKELTQEGIREFEQDAEQTVQNSVSESQNTRGASTIAPPSPPSIGG